MFAAGLYQRRAADTSATVFMVLEGVLFVCGLITTSRHTAAMATDFLITIPLLARLAG
jgi:hypothetical protein